MEKNRHRQAAYAIAFADRRLMGMAMSPVRTLTLRWRKMDSNFQFRAKSTHPQHRSIGKRDPTRLSLATRVSCRTHLRPYVAFADAVAVDVAATWPAVYDLTAAGHRHDVRVRRLCAGHPDIHACRLRRPILRTILLPGQVRTMRPAFWRTRWAGRVAACFQQCATIACEPRQPNAARKVCVDGEAVAVVNS
jgi:hypothetical protein